MALSGLVWHRLALALPSGWSHFVRPLGDIFKRSIAWLWQNGLFVIPFGGPPLFYDYSATSKKNALGITKNLKPSFAQASSTASFPRTTTNDGCFHPTAVQKAPLEAEHGKMQSFAVLASVVVLQGSQNSTNSHMCHGKTPMST